VTINQIIESANMRAMIRERDAAYAELDRGGRPGVTVCIPCFNQAEYLSEALESVAAQTVPPLEVLVIDDGSTDDTGAVASVWAQSLPLGLVRVTNRGLPNARNTALMLARGEAFLPLDADDWLDPHYIERTLPLLEAGADVVLTGIQEHGEQRNGAYMPGFDMPWTSVSVDILLYDYNRFYYCSLFRTRTLREVGGYNGRMTLGYEDWDLWIDLMKRGVRFDAVQETLFNYRTKASSMWHEAEARRAEIVAEIHRHHGA
jgi:glycosyltransferase involved in cell wall biosynthesis